MKLRAMFLTISICNVVLLGALSGRAQRLSADNPPGYTQFLPLTTANYCSSFYDDFTSDSSGWFTGTFDSLRAEITGGEYRLNFTGGGSMWLIPGPMCARTNYLAAVDVRWSSSPGNFIGLLFELDEEENDGYLFAINTDDRLWFVFKVQGNALDTVIAPVGNDAVLPGNAVNRLAVSRVGETIILMVNGIPVGELRDNSPARPVVAGVAAASYTTQVSASARFDNFIFEGAFD